MANTFITPTVVAKLALPTLLNNWVMAGLVHRDYSKEFRKIGEKVRIRKPATLITVEFDGDLTGQYQNVVESYVDVLLDTILVVPVEVSARDMTLDIVSFNTQVVEPAMQSLGQKVDEKLALLYKDIPYFMDIDETSAATILASLLGARKIQNDNKVPFAQARNAVMSTLTTATLLGLDAFRDLDKSGDTKALKEASLGRKFGYQYFESQNVQHHTRGTADGLGSVTAEEPKGETSITLGDLGTGTIKKGTIITFTAKAGQYVVTADAAISSNAATVIIYPGLAEVVAATTVATLHGGDAAEEAAGVENLMFHKNCFAFVSAPLAEPIGGAKGVTMNYKGLTINVVYDYVSQQMKNIMTFSILCGFKTMTPELGVRLYEAS